MSLEFQPRTDGYRVVRHQNGMERMLAHVYAKTLSGYDTSFNALYSDLPRGECKIHSAIGPLTVADIEEILAGLPNT